MREILGWKKMPTGTFVNVELDGFIQFIDKKPFGYWALYKGSTRIANFELEEENEQFSDQLISDLNIALQYN